jgi:beta-glucosidase
MENRTYRYFKGEPLYPFGFGLSYTSFKYDQLDLPDVYMSNTDLKVQVNVTNTGKMDGDEVVQLYLSHKNASFRTPIRVLKGFQRIHLKAGETKTVSFSLCDKDLMEIDSNGNQLPMQGDVEISIGGSQSSAKSVSEGKTVLKTIAMSGK